MKVYVSADMEGLAGVVTDAQLGEDGFDYERACELYTAEVLATIEGARAAGASEITVSDSHGNGQNLYVDRMPTGVRLVRSWPRSLGMMEGIDESFAGAILVGYHSGSHNPRGVRAHTLSSAVIHTLALNGRTICEAELSAYLAGSFSVPVLMISGDDALAAEIEDRLPGVETVVTKRAIAYHSAETSVPADVLPMLRLGAERAVARRAEIAPVVLEGEVVVDLTFKNHRPAEILDYLPVVERTGSHSIRHVAADIVAASRFLEFLLNYEPGLQP